ncbi:hypothetical protein BOX15_Mlig003350g3, partial [Macrostomum lignano]
LEQIKLVCKKLAASEEPVRIKGFLGAKKLLSGAEAVSFDNMMLIMKGLHYMLWMQDQPIKHEDIVDMICSLLGAISSPKNKLNFIKALFETEAREWSSIDFWRADKFMMLVRRFLKASLAFLQSNEWSSELVSQFVQILRDSVVNADFNQPSNGLKLHLADIVARSSASPPPVQMLCWQFCDPSSILWRPGCTSTTWWTRLSRRCCSIWPIRHSTRRSPRSRTRLSRKSA